MNESIKIILSDTSKGLWENDIPSVIMQQINKHYPKVYVTDLQRHDLLLISIFESYYDTNLIRCPYASVYHVQKSIQQYYSVVQLYCYQHKLPEILKIDKLKWISHCKLINERTDHIVDVMGFRKLYWREKWLKGCSLIDL